MTTNYTGYAATTLPNGATFTHPTIEVFKGCRPDTGKITVTGHGLNMVARFPARPNAARRALVWAQAERFRLRQAYYPWVMRRTIRGSLERSKAIRAELGWL